MSFFQFLYLFCLLLFIACFQEISIDDNVFRYNEASSITSLDPVFANNQSNIWAVNQIFNTLIELDSNLNIIPGIAKKWNYSDNNLIYNFIIRNDVYYHKSPCFGKDSTRLLIASDFIYSIKRLVDPNILSPGAWVMDYIDINNTYAVNDTSLVISLKKPFPSFLSLLSMNYFSFIPSEAIDYFGSDFSKHPVGTGPFYFKYWKQNEKLILKRNINYFEHDDSVQLPHLDAISISFITQKESVFMNFILGNYDFVSGLDNSFKDEFLNQKGELLDKYKNNFFLLSTPYLNTEYLGINISKAQRDLSPLMFKDFRKALNYSFDRSVMSDYLRNGLVTPAEKGFVPSVLSKCYDVEGFFYSPDSVHKLLSNIPNRTQKVTLNTTSDYLDICEFIQHSASKFGINIDIEIASPAVHRELFSSTASSFFRASWIGDYPDPENFLALFYFKNKSPFGPNYTHFNNEEYDSLYQLSFNNQYDRCELFSNMESILLEESTIIPLYYDHAVRLVSKDIIGMSINSMNSLSLKRVKKFNSK